MRLSLAALAVVLIALVALAVNFVAGVGGHCFEEGFSSPCGWTWTLSGWVVLACLAGLIGIAAAAVIRRAVRPTPTADDDKDTPTRHTV